MNVKTVSRLINSPPHTIRRWTAIYGPFLSEAAAPPHGVEREFSEHDLKVLNYIITARKARRMHDEITHELETMQRADWANLPDVPEEWLERSEDGLMPVSEAGERGHMMAELAVLQVQFQAVRAQLDQAQERADTLQRKLDDALNMQYTSSGEIADLRVQLAEARGDIKSLEARLSTYAIIGDRPLPVAGIILVTALAVAILVTILVLVLQFGA